MPRSLDQARGCARTALAAFVAASILAGVGAAHAQADAKAGTQISGAELQSWLDRKFSYAGVHHRSGCYFFNSPTISGRMLVLSCPDGWSTKIEGSARVKGETMCTHFDIPRSPPGEECLSWHALGNSAFEQRSGTAVSTSLFVLPVAKR